MLIDPIPEGSLTTPLGYLAGAVSAGIKTKPGALDLCLLYSERETVAAAVFTQSLVKGAPVILSQERVADGRLRAVVVNSGCANALNGPGGREDALRMTALAAEKLDRDPDEVAVASTGVTGVRLPMAKIEAALPSLTLWREGGSDFAAAIMTTDTFAKQCAFGVRDSAGVYSIGGCAKGVGMIHPNMATMLAYVTTDAAVEAGLLRELVRNVADETLNMLTVDGDTSCSDTLLVLANGASDLPQIEAGTPRAAELREALSAVCLQLTRMLARDGEGAKRLIEVEVRRAASLADARLIARTIASSPLVKTAAAGADPNWGRILVAAGRAGGALDLEKLDLRLQGELIFAAGVPLPFDDAALSARLDSDEVRIGLDLGLGEARAKAWGCDLTTDYVHINADYRT